MLKHKYLNSKESDYLFNSCSKSSAGYREERWLCESTAPLSVCVAANPLIKPVQSGLTGLLTGLVH